MRFASLALLSLCVAITGCDKAEDGVGTGIDAAASQALSLFDPVAATYSLCGSPAIPFPNNALFASSTSPTGVTTDTTLNIPSAASTAVAANLTDGFSTTASIFTDFLGLVDYSTTAAGLVVVEADATPRILVEGVDYTVQPYVAMAQVSGTGGGCVTDGINLTTFYNFANIGDATFAPVNQQFRSRLLIEPLKPLNPSTVYLVAVTRDLLSTDGVPAVPSQMFQAMNRDEKLCRLSPGGTPEAGTEVLCTDPAAPAQIAAALDAPLLGALEAPSPQAGQPPLTGAAAAATRLTTLETLRRNLLRPGVTALKQFQNALADPDLTDDDLVIAWSFTTQSIGATLQTLNAIQTAKTFAVANTGLSTGDLGLGLADTADIWAGTLNAVPYYLDDATSGVNDTGPLTGYWHNNGTATCNSFATCAATGGFVPWTPVADYDANGATPNTPAFCTTGAPPFNFVAPVSTTNCHRIPVANGTDAQGNTWGSLENLPVLVLVPNATSGQTKPTGGWPVVIFQHGITGNRTQALAIAPTLASQGFVVVSIDLPLHGLVPSGSTATCGSTANNAFYIAGGNERTFDLDLVNNVTGAAGPDGVTDCSGTHFINLSSLITSRDNIRQAVADQIHLVKSLQAANPINLDGDGATDDIDETRMHFAGISLGSIVGTTYLGIDTGASATADGSDEAIIAASLSVPGGGLGKLLDASGTFGPRIAAGLAGTAFSGAGSTGVGSPFEGTDTYETFVRFAQHLIDPGDPINYATAAVANHRIHLTQVENDTVVPNNATTTCPAPDAMPDLFFQAADNTLAATRDAACDASIAMVGTNATTAALCNGGVTVTTGACPPVIASGTRIKDGVVQTGFLSGTTPLFTFMGLTEVAPITPPTTCANNTNGAGLDVAVRFAIGTHGSLLTPAGPGGATQFLAVTTEMQRQAATFFASNGLTLASGSCP